GGEAVRELLRVVVANAEDQARTGIRHERGSHVRIGLVDRSEGLVRGRESKPVLAGAGQDVLDRRRYEILKLVDHEIEVTAGFLTHVLAAHRRLVELRDNKTSEERRVLFPDCALRELREEDALPVEDFAEVETALPLREHGAEGLRAQKAVEPR